MSKINKYDDIDFCVNTLHDFAYSKNKTQKCYKIKYIQKNNIQLNDIKKKNDFDYNNILKAEIKYIGKNKSRYIFKRYSDTTYPTMIRIGTYNQKNSNINSMKRGELVNMIIPYIFSEFVLTEDLKFILFPIMNFDIIYKDLKKINPSVTKVIKSIKNDTVLYVQVLEHYFKLFTLKDFLNKNMKFFTIKHWKVLIFQILYALYKIGNKYPTFRHNSLDLDSIYVYKRKNGSGNIYTILKKKYNVPNMGFEIKITNFDKSVVTNIVDNIDTNKTSENLYYDVHYIIGF